MNGFGPASNELVTLVELLELQDLPLAGSNFFFFEGRSRCSHSRLDRFFIRDIEVGWSDRVVQQELFKFASNHLPIILSSDLVSSAT